MSEKTYSMKEVTAMLDIESYVLRYYEKELELDIHRNSQGHRIYDKKDIELLAHIKELREQGLELRAVKHILTNGDTEGVVQLIGVNKAVVPVQEQEIDITDAADEHVMQFTMILKDILKQGLSEYHETTKEEIKEELSEEMQALLDKKMREFEVSTNEKNENYYYRMDETMREMQRVQKELAALKEIKEVKKKEGLFKRMFGNKKTQEIEAYEKESM